MRGILSRIRTRYGDREGIVLPVIILGLVLMSTLAVAALMTAGDEHRSSRAMREASTAFYAAEAGLNNTYAQWSTYQAQIDSIEPGDTLDLGWQQLSSGGSYRPKIVRLDNGGGGQPLYALQAEGRGLGAMSGRRTLRLLVTTSDGGGGEAYKLGDCCDAAAVVRGTVEIEDQTGIDGRDTHPPGWEAAGVCSDSTYDKPGLMMQDTSLFQFQDDYWLSGEPPLAQDAYIDDSSFDTFGDLTWTELAGMAEKFLDDEDVDLARPSTKLVDGETVCDTADPYNFGSDDPTHPCFNYFPIVLINDDVTIRNGYAQGIFVLEWDEATHAGSEFDLEGTTQLSGIILGKGCVEPEEDSRVYGSIYVDGEYRNYDICITDRDLAMNDGDSTLRFSQCAVDRALLNSALAEYAEASVPGESGVSRRLVSRSFMEVF